LLDDKKRVDIYVNFNKKWVERGTLFIPFFVYNILIKILKKIIMKKFPFLMLFILFMFVYSCSKDNDATSSVLEAEKRLGGPAYWEISDASINGEYLIKNKIILDSTNFVPAEWFKFDTNEKTIEVKYNDEPETSLFNYVIEGNNFKVYENGNSGEAEIMTIKSGSVFDDNFTLEQKDEDDIVVFKFVAK
jgi:hypothetical protein